MNKLTAEKCKEKIAECQALKERGYLSISGEYTLQALEIALPVLEQQEAKCEKCNGTGEMDSGGTQPWGDAIMVKCDCQSQPTTPQIDNDGWIKWGGGECPVPESSMVRFKCRDGEDFTSLEAREIGWFHDGSGDDIIAYRVIENDGREG